jgi:hypothetical protein
VKLLSSLVVAVLLMVGRGRVGADPVRGQSVIYKNDSTHSYPAIVVGVVDSDEADLAVLADGTLWYALGNTYTAEGTPVLYIADVQRGSGNGQWLENDAFGSRISSQSNPSLSLNGVSVQMDATKDAELTMSVTVALPLSLVAGATGTVHLFCDASSTPTTEVVTLQRGNTGGLVTTDTATLQLHHRVRGGDYCKVTTTADVGSPTFSIVRQLRQVID